MRRRRKRPVMMMATLFLTRRRRKMPVMTMATFLPTKRGGERGLR